MFSFIDPVFNPSRFQPVMKHSPNFIPRRFLGACLSLLLLPCSSAWSDDDPLRIGFSFNEGTQAGSGGVVTDFYNTQNGSFTGTWTGDTYFRPGFSGEEGDFSITSGGNRVRVDINNAFGTDWGSFTVETHFTIGEEVGFRRLIDLHGHEVLLQKNSANRLRTNLIQDPADNQTGVLEGDRWYHAAVVYDTAVEGVEIRFYLDGELWASGPARNPWPTEGPTRLVIGASDTGGSPWNGFIDNVRITQAALTPEEFLLDGFGTELNEPPPPPDPLPDAAELQFFWTELDLGEIHTRRADGSGSAVLVSGLNRPIGIQVDEENEHLYWSEDGVLGESDNGRISRSSLNGSDVVVLYDATAGDAGLGNPQGIVLDTAGGWIYWADYMTGIYRAPLDGSGPVQPIFNDAGERYTALDLDLVNNHIYFGNPNSGALYAVDTSGNIVVWGATGVIGNGLLVDMANDRLFYSDSSSVSTSDLFGFNPEVLTGNLSLPLGIAFDPEKERVFFAERGGLQQIGVVGVDGSGGQPVLIGLDNPFGLAVIRSEPLPGGYAQWLEENFTPEELLDDSISGPAAVPAGDGVANLLKFALGLSAKTPSRELLPAAAMMEGSLRLTFDRAKVDGVSLVVEASDDLNDWSTQAVEEISVEDLGDFERVTVEVSASAVESGKVFLRLRATEL